MCVFVCMLANNRIESLQRKIVWEQKGLKWTNERTNVRNRKKIIYEEREKMREREIWTKPEKRMIIKRKACIIINQIMYLLSECTSVHEALSHWTIWIRKTEWASDTWVRSETNSGCDVKWLRGFCVLWKYIEMTKAFSCRYTHTHNFQNTQWNISLYFTAQKINDEPLCACVRVNEKPFRQSALAVPFISLSLNLFQSKGRNYNQSIRTNRKQCIPILDTFLFLTMLLSVKKIKRRRTREESLSKENAIWIIWLRPDVFVFIVNETGAYTKNPTKKTMIQIGRHFCHGI